MKTKLSAVLLGVIAAFSLFTWWEPSGIAIAQQAAPAGPPTEVTVHTIAAKNITLSKDLPGRTSAYRVAEIRPQVNGIVVKRLFEEGSDVKVGQQLYQIDPAVYQATVDSAEADLMKADANAKSVLAKSARYAELVKIGGISKQEYDDIKAGVAQANADIAIAKAKLANAKINLDYTKVFSPIDGRIGKSIVTEGALVTQNQTAPLAVVQQLNPIYVDVTQSSLEVMKLRGDMSNNSALQLPVDLFLDGAGNKAYGEKGTFQFSDVSVDETTGTSQLRILFPNPKLDLLPGLFVRARIGQVSADNALLVPQKAVSRNPDGSTVVMVVGEGNKVAPQPIKVSDAIGDQWLVNDGLKIGDRVIVEGIMKAPPGSVVKPVEDTASQDKLQPAPQLAK